MKTTHAEKSLLANSHVDLVIDATSKGLSLRNPPLRVKPSVDADVISFVQRGDSTVYILWGIAVASGVMTAFSFALQGLSGNFIFFVCCSMILAGIATLRSSSYIRVSFDFTNGLGEYTLRRYGFPIRYSVPMNDVTVYLCEVDIVRNPFSWNGGFGVVIEVGKQGQLLALCLDRDPLIVQQYANELPARVRSLISRTKAHVIGQM